MLDEAVLCRISSTTATTIGRMSSTIARMTDKATFSEADLHEIAIWVEEESVRRSLELSTPTLRFVQQKGDGCRWFRSCLCFRVLAMGVYQHCVGQNDRKRS
jgi:ribosomal protein L28